MEGAGSADRGVSLQDIIQRSGALPPAAALLLLDDVLERLEHTSKVGVQVDLQPASILVDHFGRCHVLTMDDASGAVGSPAARVRYAPPEARLGGVRPGPPGDVFAATALFVEAVTSLPPDEGRAVMLAAEGDGAAPPAIRSLIERGMAADAAERPDGPGQLRELVAESAEAAFPGVDWRSRGRSWLSAASPAPIAAAPVSSTYTPSFTASSTTSYTPSFVPPFAPRSSAPSDDGPLGPAPGLFTRMLHGDASVIAGFLITICGALLIIIGAGAASSISGPRISAASDSPTAPPNPADSGPTPQSIGSEFLPVAPPPPPDASTPSPSPGASGSPSPSAAPTPVPSDQPPPSIFAAPTDTPAPTATPGCILIFCPH